jgi:hypothetical protein
MIIFVAVGAVISVSLNTKKLFTTLEKEKNFNLISSIALVEQKNVKNLYSEAVDFNITDDRLISLLKKNKITFTKTLDNSFDYNITDTKKLTFSVMKLKVYNSEYSNHIYGIEIK